MHGHDLKRRSGDSVAKRGKLGFRLDRGAARRQESTYRMDVVKV